MKSSNSGSEHGVWGVSAGLVLGPRRIGAAAGVWAGEVVGLRGAGDAGGGGSSGWSLVGEDDAGQYRLDDVGIGDGLHDPQAPAAGACQDVYEEHSEQKMSVWHDRGSGRSDRVRGGRIRRCGDHGSIDR